MISPPVRVDGAKMGTEDFRQRYGLASAEEECRKRNLTLGIANTLAYFNFFRKKAPQHLLVPLYSLATIRQAIQGYTRSHWGLESRAEGGIPGVEQVGVYRFEGITMDVYRFDDYPSLNRLLEDLHLEVPDSARQEVERYRAHYISYLTLQLMPPVEKEVINFLEENCPKTVEGFMAWLRERGTPPGMDGETWNHWVQEAESYPQDLPSIVGTAFGAEAVKEFERAAGGEAANEPFSSVKTRAIMKKMMGLVEAYLSLPAEGYRLRFCTQLGDMVWYPLGTSSSWAHPIGLTEVLVKLPDGLWLDNANPYPAGRYSGHAGRFFYWRFTGANPEQDISGTVASKDEEPVGLVVRNGLACLLNYWYKPVAAVTNILLLCLIWLSATQASLALSGSTKVGAPKHQVARSLALGVLTFFLSTFSVLVAVPVLCLRLTGRTARGYVAKVFPFSLLALALFMILAGIGGALYFGALVGMLCLLIVSVILFLILAVDVATGHLVKATGSRAASRVSKFWVLASLVALFLAVLCSFSLVVGVISIACTLVLATAKVRFPGGVTPGI